MDNVEKCCQNLFVTEIEYFFNTNIRLMVIWRIENKNLRWKLWKWINLKLKKQRRKLSGNQWFYGPQVFSLFSFNEWTVQSPKIPPVQTKGAIVEWEYPEMIRQNYRKWVIKAFGILKRNKISIIIVIVIIIRNIISAEASYLIKGNFCMIRMDAKK